MYSGQLKSVKTEPGNRTPSHSNFYQCCKTNERMILKLKTN